MKYRKFALIVLSFIILLSFTACTNQDNVQKKFLPSDFVATLADRNIGVPEFTFYLRCVRSDMEKEAGIKSTDANAVKGFWMMKINGVDPVETAKNKTLETLEEINVLLLRAQEEKVQLEQGDLQKVKAHMESVIKTEGQGDKAKAEKTINAKYGVSLAEYESIYKDYMLAYNKYGSRLTSKIKISDDDIKKHYEENIDKYDKVTVKHILLTTKQSASATASPERVAQTQELAEKILDEAKSGTNFEDLVKLYSEDPETKKTGGEYTFKKGEMLKEFEDWSFNAKPGDMGIIQSKYGYHVMKFIKKVTLEDQKSDIKHELELEELKKDLKKWETDKNIELIVNQDIYEAIRVL